MSLILPAMANAGTYWVSPTGTAPWSSCSGIIPISGTSACSLATANASAAAGDIVYLRAGTYSSGGITPSNSGNGTSLPSNMIAFQAYTGETPNITYTGGDQLVLSGLSYIRIIGITFTKTTNINYRLENGANHNEIYNCTFLSTNGWNMSILIDSDGGTFSTNNWFHGNHLVTSGQAHGNGGTGCTDGGGDSLDIGVSYGTFNQTSGDNDNNNTIENNFFEYSPHTNIENFGVHNVIRNNVFHNEPWSTASSACTASATNPATYTNTAYNGKYGHRNFTTDNDYNARTATNTLIEGNRSGFAGVNDTNDGADNFTLGGAQDIFRYNFSFASMNPGVMLKWGWNNGNGSGGNAGYNRIFNNTFYDNGLGYPWGLTCTLSTCPWDETNYADYMGAGHNLGNVVKNNIFYMASGEAKFGSDVLNKGVPSNDWAVLAAGSGNNWCTAAQTGGDAVSGGASGCTAYGNPMFNNPNVSSTTSQTLPDLSLQSGSTAIDQGAYLTTATNSGTISTSLTVADAMFFQDGSWGSDLAKSSAGLGGTMQADWIAIGTVTNIVPISSIVYGTYNNPTGTITLAAPMTWTTGAPIWLYQKSDGGVVLAGNAPDLGASEYLGALTSAPVAPTNVQVAAQ